MPTTTPEKTKFQTGQTFDFYSRNRSLRLIRIPQAVVPDGWGGQVKRERYQGYPGSDRCVYEFTNGHLEVVVGAKNWDVFPDGPDGEEQNTVQWLQAHEEFNRRFHQAGNEPDRPLPTEEDFLTAVNEASMNLDVETIVEMLRTERETHKRPTLMKVADDARKRTLALKQQLSAQGPPEPPEAA